MRKSKPKPRSKANALSIQRRKVPAATSVSIRARQPTIVTTPRGTRVTGAELVAVLNGSTGFSSGRIAVNPGLPDFVRLSNQAAGFEKYKIRRWKIRYVPSQAVTTTAGSVYLGFDYDPTDAPPTTLAALSTYASLKDGRTFETFDCPGNVSTMHDGIQVKMLRSTPVPGSTRGYDACSMIWATTDMINTNPIGQLWVEYDVELISRQTETPVIANSINMNYATQFQSFTTTPSLVTWTNAYAGFPVPLTGGNIFQLPGGAYIATFTLNTQRLTTATSVTAAAIIAYSDGSSATVRSYNMGGVSTTASGVVQNESGSFQFLCLDTGTMGVSISVSAAPSGTVSTLHGYLDFQPIS